MIAPSFLVHLNTLRRQSLQSPAPSGLFVRALAVWCVLICVEFAHGTVPGQFASTAKTYTRQDGGFNLGQSETEADQHGGCHSGANSGPARISGSSDNK